MKKQEISEKYAIGYIYKQVGSHDYTNAGRYDFNRTFRQNVVNAAGRSRYEKGAGYYVYFTPFVGDPVMMTKEK